MSGAWVETKIITCSYFKFQLVCDVNRVFVSLHVGCAGSLHDSNVYQHMQICKNPHEYYGKDQYLLADSGYASSHWIVPAYKGVTSHSEDNQKFNLCLARSRVRIEQSIGVLKGQWSSLCNVQEVQLFVQWVVTCVMLHNLLAQVSDQWRDLYEDNCLIWGLG